MKATVEEYLNLNVVNIHEWEDITITYSKDIEQQLTNEAKNGHPYEITGFLLGEKGVEDKVTIVYPVKNIAKFQERRFEINDLDYLKVEQYALANNLDVIGIYHSHPDYPAIPSEYDLKNAQDVFSYVIISVDSTGFSLINSWKKKDEKFVQQEIRIIN